MLSELAPVMSEENEILAENALHHRLLQALKSDLSRSRFEHVVQTALYSRNLAGTANAPALLEKAVTAALLHDLTKEKPEAFHLQMFQRAGRENLRDLPRALWHGQSAAIAAELDWQIEDPEVLEAVSCHSSGKKNMGLLACILFGADFLASLPPKKARHLGRKPLGQICLKKITSTIAYLMAENQIIHEDAFACYNWLIQSHA